MLANVKLSSLNFDMMEYALVKVLMGNGSICFHIH